MKFQKLERRVIYFATLMAVKNLVPYQLILYLRKLLKDGEVAIGDVIEVLFA